MTDRAITRADTRAGTHPAIFHAIA
ncbi:MAG: hypothetical protein RJA24_1617, partial [Pseudomonadota bacterium]